MHFRWNLKIQVKCVFAYEHMNVFMHLCGYIKYERECTIGLVQQKYCQNTFLTLLSTL